MDQLPEMMSRLVRESQDSWGCFRRSLLPDGGIRGSRRNFAADRNVGKEVVGVVKRSKANKGANIRRVGLMSESLASLTDYYIASLCE